MYILLCILFFVGCVKKNNDVDANVTTTITPIISSTNHITTTTVATKEPIELIIGKYVEDAEEYPTSIVLHEDKSVELTLNFCSGMANIKGVYEIDDNNILTITFIHKGVEGDEAKFEIISSTTLKYIPKTYTYNKADIFSCAYVDIYNLSE